MPSTTESQARAEKHDREQQVLAAIALAALLATMLPFDTAVQRTAETGESATYTLAPAISPLIERVTDIAVASFILGRRRGMMELAEHLDQPFAPPQVTEEEVAAIADAYAGRALADVTRLTMWTGEQIDEAMGYATPEERLAAGEARLSSLGLSVENPYAIQTVLLDAAHGAYHDGVLSLEDAAGATGVLIGWEYVTMRDERVRRTHAELDGTVASVGDYNRMDLFRQRMAEPRCRCVLLPVFGKSASDLPSESPHDSRP